jgi:lysozyme
LALYANGITLDQANAIFDQDVASAVSAVNRLITVSLTQGQFDALVDFQFNTGGLAGSTLLRDVNSGNPNSYLDLGSWVFSSQQISNGLIDRREGEMCLYMGAGGCTNRSFSRDY